MIKLLHGYCLEQMQTLPDNSVDAIVTDPPYGINFMGKKWDYDVPSVEVWREAMRVLKPGGHALIACGTRTQHRMVVNIEDAGFQIRDVVSWIYGSGFPKSLNVSKAIDKAAGAEREVVGECKEGNRENASVMNSNQSGFSSGNITVPATDAAKEWDGWGTALKPACEFFTLCRKPLSEKTVAANVLKWGTGGINIDGCRVEGGEHPKIMGLNKAWQDPGALKQGSISDGTTNQGRFPANLIHDGSQMVLELFPDSNGSGKARKLKRSAKRNQEGWGMKEDEVSLADAGKGSAARFFYCPKASKADRDEGLGGFEDMKNTHPTVKPTALMAYLCRLITPPGGTILDPYMGSGSTGKAAVKEGFGFIGIDKDKDYYNIAKARIKL